MKKAIAAAACLLACALFLTACGAGEAKTALEIDGAKIDTEVYAYYLNEAIADPQSAPEQTAQEAATLLCKEYVAVNTKFEEYGCSLTTEQKVFVTEQVNSLWRLYESYYTDIGVTKQAMTKIVTNDIRREALLLRLYDSDGMTPAPEADIQHYFTENFIVFRAINGYLTDMDEEGNIAPISEEKRAQLVDRFVQMTDQVNGGEDIVAVNKTYLAAQGAAAGADTELPPLVVERGNPNYPAGFFEEVMGMDTTTAKVTTLGNYIYVVKRMDAMAEGSTYYAENRTACLTALRANDFDALLRDEWASAYSVKTHDRAVRQCARRIEKQRTELFTAAVSTTVSTAEEPTSEETDINASDSAAPNSEPLPESSPAA